MPMVTKLARAIALAGRPGYKVAADAGLQPWQLSEYVNGRKPISPVHLARLAETLDADPEDLVGLIEEVDA
jgi:plasmid maintenance system antidote protein VapI